MNPKVCPRHEQLDLTWLILHCRWNSCSVVYYEMEVSCCATSAPQITAVTSSPSRYVSVEETKHTPKSDSKWIDGSMDGFMDGSWMDPWRDPKQGWIRGWIHGWVLFFFHTNKCLIERKLTLQRLMIPTAVHHKHSVSNQRLNSNPGPAKPGKF